MQFYKKHPKKSIALLIVALLIIFHAPPPEIYVQVDAPAGFSQLPVRIKLIQPAVSGGRNWHGGLRSYDLGTIWVKPNTREILQPDDIYYSTGILPSVYHPTMERVFTKSNSIDWKGNFEGELGEYERLGRWFMRIFIQPSPIEITFNMLPLEEAVDLDLQKSLRGRGVKTLEEAGLEHNKQSAVVQTVQGLKFYCQKLDRIIDGSLLKKEMNYLFELVKKTNDHNENNKNAILLELIENIKECEHV